MAEACGNGWTTFIRSFSRRVYIIRPKARLQFGTTFVRLKADFGWSSSGFRRGTTCIGSKAFPYRPFLRRRLQGRISGKQSSPGGQRFQGGTNGRGISPKRPIQGKWPTNRRRASPGWIFQEESIVLYSKTKRKTPQSIEVFFVAHHKAIFVCLGLNKIKIKKK